MYPYQKEKTINGLFFSQAERYGDEIFGYAKLENGVEVDLWVPLSWREAALEARRIGAGLIELGVGKGDRVAVFAHNRPRWVIADQAIQGVGAIGVPIYPTSTDEQLEYIVNDCGARAVFAGDDHLLAQTLRVKKETPSLQYVIGMTPLKEAAESGVMDFDSLAERGKASAAALAEFETRRHALTGADAAAIIYTSGTTGEPKGAVLSQSNFMADVEMLLDNTLIKKMMDRGVRFSTLCHLPLCHVYGRTSDYHVQLAMGGVIYFAESYAKVPQNLLEVRPQMLITIPRLYEKVHEIVTVQSGKMKGAPRKIFDWAMKVGDEVVDHLSQGQRLPTLTALKFALAGTLVYNRIRKMSGLDRLAFAASGGGALSAETNRFLRSMNIQVGEGYGLTETTSAITWNSLEFLEPLPDTWLYRKALDYLVDTMVVMQSQGVNPFTNPVGMFKLTVASNLVVPLLVQKPGTVGRPCKDTDIKIAADGEILAKGPQVFKEYFNRPDLTAEAFDEDGWFKTGDIGRFDEDGFVVITDRKKELLVTAGGKNVAPHPIEMALALDTFIDQACVIGDAKKYLAALIVPQFELLEKWARDKGLAFADQGELARLPEVKALYREKIDKVNAKLPRYEQIKTFCLLAAAFSEETGELTPTLKMKRRIIHRKFNDEINSCY